MSTLKVVKCGNPFLDPFIARVHPDKVAELYILSGYEELRSRRIQASGTTKEEAVNWLRREVEGRFSQIT